LVSAFIMATIRTALRLPAPLSGLALAAVLLGLGPILAVSAVRCVRSSKAKLAALRHPA
jgi:hypothetical protein